MKGGLDMTASCTALDVANFLVYMMSDSCEDLTNMKLNKILYYAQGHYLRKFGTPLFRDKIEAWTHGPVVPTVYATYKAFGDQPITKFDSSKLNNLDETKKSFLLDVARVYGRYTASVLRSMTHQPKSPWNQTGEGKEIPIETIKSYFEKHENEIGPLDIHFSNEDFIGQKNADGVLVLPQDWADEEI